MLVIGCLLYFKSKVIIKLVIALKCCKNVPKFKEKGTNT